MGGVTSIWAHQNQNLFQSAWAITSLNIHRAEPTIRDQKDDKHQWWFAVGLFFDRSKHHIHHSGRQQLPIRATLSDFGGALIWTKNFRSRTSKFRTKSLYGRRIYSLLILGTKKGSISTSANDGITWAFNTRWFDMSSSIRSPRWYGIPLIILESFQVAEQLHCCRL